MVSAAPSTMAYTRMMGPGRRSSDGAPGEPLVTIETDGDGRAQVVLPRSVVRGDPDQPARQLWLGLPPSSTLSTSRQRLESMGRVRRSFTLLWWLLKELILRLAPLRRLMLVLALLLLGLGQRLPLLLTAAVLALLARGRPILCLRFKTEAWSCLVSRPRAIQDPRPNLA